MNIERRLREVMVVEDPGVRVTDAVMARVGAHAVAEARSARVAHMADARARRRSRFILLGTLVIVGAAAAGLWTQWRGVVPPVSPAPASTVPAPQPAAPESEPARVASSFESDPGKNFAIEPSHTDNRSPESLSWSPNVLAFAEQADPDPALSRELEYWIGHFIDTRVDAGRYEVQSIKCRGYTCQILAVDGAPGGATSWTAVVSAMFHSLDDASIRNPTTGLEVGAPMPTLLETVAGGGLVTLIAFKAQ